MAEMRGENRTGQEAGSGREKEPRKGRDAGRWSAWSARACSSAAPVCEDGGVDNGKTELRAKALIPLDLAEDRELPEVPALCQTRRQKLLGCGAAQCEWRGHRRVSTEHLRFCMDRLFGGKQAPALGGGAEGSCSRRRKRSRGEGEGVR